MRNADDIAQLWFERRRRSGRERERMRQVRDLVNGDIVVPLSEIDSEDRPAVINLAKQGVNQMAMRAASTKPFVRYIAADFGHREKARKRADMKRRVNHGWWGANRMQLQLRQRGRWMFAYASSPVLIRPCFDRRSRTYDMPMWQPRNPLDTYAAPQRSQIDYCVDDAIFAQTRSVGWLRSRYPAAALPFRDASLDDLVDVLEYVDHEQISLVACLGARRWYEVAETFGAGADPFGADRHTGEAVFLEQLPNRADYPLVVATGNISLDRRVGDYDSLVGMYQAQARLMALSLLARERGVFQEAYLVQHPNSPEAPEVVVKADPRTGKLGVVRGGTIVRTNIDPQFATDTGIDRLERAQRVEAGVPADWGGESASNIRTARRGADVIAATIDPRLHEIHDIFAASLEDENRVAIKVDRAWFGNDRKSFHVSWAGDYGKVTYTPNDVFADGDTHEVKYPLPGGDVHDINIATGQAIGAGVMSKRTAAELNPLIENPEAEHDAVIAERLEEALLNQILTLAQSPEGPYQPVDLARIAQIVASDKKELFEAVMQVQREAQERQAAVAETPADAMPGLSMPGQGAEAQGAFQTTPSQQGLTQLLRSLTLPQVALGTARGA